MTIVYALDTLAAGTSSGLTLMLHAGDPWAADDPFVRERPELFGPEPPVNSVRRTAAPVEQATAAPGEMRRGPGRPRLHG